jgi:SAM-dependent methyltransferase
VRREENDWWESFYDENLAELFLVRSDREELEATLRFLVEKLRIAPGSAVFDQCCGIGSLSIPLAQRGAYVIGADITESYIQRAKADARAARASCEFYAADAFGFVPDRPCDAAFNWWTSFGYAPEDARNIRMLQRAFDALKPGGRFALDYPNLACVLADFKPSLVRRHATARGEIVLLRESTLNLGAGLLEQLWTYILPDGRRVPRRSAVKMYLPHVLVEMFKACGFVEIELHGGVRGEPLRPESIRCICIGKRWG